MKAVIFDLDGTLVLSAQLHYRAYQQAIGVKRFSVSYKIFKTKYYGCGARYIVAHFLEKNETDKVVTSYAKKKQKQFGNLLRIHQLRTVTGVRQILKKLTVKNISLAIASAAQKKSIIAMLQKTRLEKYFPVVISGEDVPRTKPAPDIFLLAAKKLGLSPKDCLVFEDSSEGVTAAKKAGMMCIALLTTRSKKELLIAGADQVIKDYNTP